MSKSRRLQYILLGVLGLLVISFLALTIMGMSMINEKSEKMVDLKLQSKVAQSQLDNLALAKKEIEQYSYFKEVAKSVIPDDKDQAQAVLDIVRYAEESGILIQSITFPSSNLGPGAGAGAATPTTGSTSATTASPSTATSQAKPVPDIKGLYSLELTITPESGTTLPAEQQITYPKMLKFLEKIERNRRTAQITQVNVQPQTNNSTGEYIDFSLIINIFIKP